MIASNRYDLLVPLISREPNTTKHVEREVLVDLVVQQKIEDEAMGVVFVFGAPPVRAITGTYKPLEAVPLRPTGDFEVLVEPIAGTSSPSLWVGPFELIAGRDYTPGGGLAATATAIAAAISNIPGYVATPVGAVVTVEGPEGKVNLPFYATYRYYDQNFSFTYNEKEGFLGYLTSPLFPIEVT